MNRNDSILQRLLLSLTLWVASSRKEEVLVVGKSENIGITRIIDIKTGVRPGGKTGLHILDEWAYNNADMLEELFCISKGYKYNPQGNYPDDSWSVINHVRPLELPSSKNEQDVEKVAKDCATLMAAYNPRNLDDDSMKEADAWLPVAAPQSNTSIRLFYRGVKSSLNHIISGLCEDTVGLVMYCLSLMNAKVMGYLGSNESGEVKTHKLVIADLSKPLYTDANGFDRYASTAGGDGNMPFTWSDQKRNDIQGQIRGFALNLLKKMGIILKGVGVGSDIFLKEDGTLTDVWEDGCSLVVVADLNMVKEKGKKTQQYKDAAACTNKYAIPRIVDETFYMWFIRVTKDAEEHTGASAASFQETIFHRAAYTKVDESQLFETIEEKICRVSPEKKAFADECLSLVEVDLVEFCLPNGKVPYASLLESTNHVVERAASAGTFQEGPHYKAWGSQLTPCGVVLMDGRQMRYKKVWDQEKADSVVAAYKGSFWKSKALEHGYTWFGRLVALKRTPQLTPWCLDTSRALAHEDLESLVGALMSGEDTWVGLDGVELDVWYSIEWLRDVHNAKVKDKKYYLKPENVWGQLYTEDEDGLKAFAKRIIEWALSLQSSRIESFFVVQPLDGRDRNEDHDGDDTMCTVDRFWVDKYVAIAAYWRRLPLFLNELPKVIEKEGKKVKVTMNWRDIDLYQLLPDSQGKLINTVNIKGATLDELFPDVSWCTEERLSKIASVTLADPQGPTGLGSNVAADLFARVQFVDCPRGRTNWRGEILLVPSKSTEKTFKLWVLYCLFVQIFIDWQKRAYRLFMLIYWKLVVEAVLKAGARGLDSFAGILTSEKMATRDSEWNGKLELATNFCYNPAIIYQLAEEELDIDVCLWKWQRGKLTWLASSDEILEDAETMAHSRFRSVIYAIHRPKTGVLANYGDSKDYVERIAEVVANKTSVKEDLLRKINQAFVYVEGETLKAGEDGDLEKVGANYRGNLFLKGLGFDRDGMEKLLDGEEVQPKGLNGSYSFKDLLIAGAHGADGREVDAFEILVSWYVSQKEVSDEAKALMSYGEEIRDNFLRGVSEMTQPKVVKPITKGNATMCYRSMYPDLGKLWDSCFDSGYDYLVSKLPMICHKAYNAGADYADMLGLAKIAASRMLQVVNTCRIQVNRSEEKYHIESKNRRAYRQPIGLPKDEVQIELYNNDNAKATKLVVESKDGDLYVRKDKKGRHIRNWDNSHFWLPAIAHDCPTRMAYQSLEYGMPFNANANAALAFSIVDRLFEHDENLLIKCRTLTSAGGYLTKEVFAEACEMATGDSEYCEEDRSDLFGALNLLRGCSSGRVTDGDEYITKGEKEYVTKAYYREEMLQGEMDMLPISEGIGEWLEEEFGLTPLPSFIQCKKKDEVLSGEDAFEHLLKMMLLFVVVEEHIVIRSVKRDSDFRFYKNACQSYLELVDKHDLPYEEGDEKAIWWFTPMATSKDSPVEDKWSRFNKLKELVVAYQDLGC